MRYATPDSFNHKQDSEVHRILIQYGQEVSDEPQQARVCAVHASQECDLLKKSKS